jgi:L-threonylcarbamoyladenylate synthase
VLRNNFEQDIKQCIKVLREGGTILYPTDTVWGIGCDATNEAAVQKVFSIKRRADSKSLILLTDSAAKLSVYAEFVPDIAYDLVEISEKPVSIVYSGARNLAKNVIAADGSVALRVTREKFSRELCMRFRKPVVSTSANISGMHAPANFAEIAENIIASVDYVVKFRQNELVMSAPSSIIKLSKNAEFQLIRI